MNKKIAINLYVLILFIAFCTYTKTKEIFESRSITIPFQTDITINSLELEKEKSPSLDLINSSIVLEPIYIEVAKPKQDVIIDETEEYVDDILKQRAIAIQNRDRLNALIAKYSQEARGTRDENEIIKINNMRKILIEARDLYSSKLQGE